MNGSVRNEYDYDTFGTRTNVKTANTGSNQYFSYTGEMSDAESGLFYLRARYYDGELVLYYFGSVISTHKPVGIIFFN